MKTKSVGLIITAFVVSLSFAPAAFAEGVPGDDDPVDEEPPTDPKGNNGWGNGIDGENAGSPKGGTAASKQNVPGSLNPKHDGKFDGR